MTESLLDIVESLPNSEEEQKKIKNLPFAEDLLKGTLDYGSLSENELEQAITAAAYLNISAEPLVDELLWKIGQTRDRCLKYFTLEEQFDTYRVRKDISPVLYGELIKQFPEKIHPEQIHVRSSKVVKNVNYLHRCARVGNLRLVKYLDAVKANQRTDDVCMAAVIGNHLDCLKFLHEKRYPCGLSSVSAAIYGGHLECLEFLHEQKYVFRSYVADYCDVAAMHGHLEILKFLVSKFSPEHEGKTLFSKNVCGLAAEKGHLACLKFLYENGASITYSTAFHAMKDEHIDCLEYISDLFPKKLHKWGKLLLADAKFLGLTRSVEFLEKRGCIADELPD